MGRKRASSLSDLPKSIRQQLGDLTVAFQKNILDTAIRIIGDVDEPRNVIGRKRGTIGTGFVVSVPSERLQGVRYAYAVTAHHVIDGERSVEIQCANPFARGELYPPFALFDWRQPFEGVDLVLCPVREDNDEGGDQTLSTLGLDKDVMTPQHIPALGSPVYYVGYLEPLNRMMVRAGTIGATEQEGVKHAQPEYDYDCHLVDCRSYRGFSGSPCFFPQSHPVLRELDPRNLVGGSVPDGLPPIGSVAHISVLCGMFTQHLDDTRQTESDGVISRYGVGILLPSLQIWRALVTDEMKKERRQWDEERKDAEGDGPALEETSRGLYGNDEYTRFELLTRHLANTPKPREDESQ